ncbi:MAG TPA: DUF881 domain-containing protein [Jatrophihabitans sp.]
MAVERSQNTTDPRRPPLLWTTALLDDLLNNPLDPGYQAAADRHAPKRGWESSLAWVGCLLIGFLLVVAYQQTHRSAPARDAARKDLISRIQGLQRAGGTMQDTAKTLAAQVAALRDAQLSAAGSTMLRDLEVASGTVAVHGPGMVVVLNNPSTSNTTDPNQRPGTTPLQQTQVLQDTDIRGVVNQLFAAGAEAIAVNGIRLTATTAIRFAGEAVLVDFQTISAPYTIEAIGPRDAMLVDFADSAVARRLKTVESVLGISFKFNGKSDLTLSSITVSQPRFAAPGTAAASPSPTSTETSR